MYILNGILLQGKSILFPSSLVNAYAIMMLYRLTFDLMDIQPKVY